MLLNFILAVSLSLAFLLEPPKSPATPPPARDPAAGDILRGPAVPADAVKPDPGRKATDASAAEKASRPMLEQRVLFASLDKLALDEATRAKVHAIRDEFAKSVDAWAKESDAKRKELFEKRKNIPTGKPVGEDFKKGMEEIEAKRPKLADLKTKLSAALSKEQMDQLRVQFDEGMKRAREELTKRTEEERRVQAEARRKKEQEMKEQGMKDQDGKDGAMNEQPPSKSKPN